MSGDNIEQSKQAVRLPTQSWKPAIMLFVLISRPTDRQSFLGDDFDSMDITSPVIQPVLLAKEQRAQPQGVYHT